MIRVLVLYPHEEGATFDHTYFMEKHLPMVKERLEPRGLLRIEVDKGISATDPNAPPAYSVMNSLMFNTISEVHQAFIAEGRAVMGDIPNYTNTNPTIQINEIVG